MHFLAPICYNFYALAAKPFNILDQGLLFSGLHSSPRATIKQFRLLLT